MSCNDDDDDDDGGEKRRELFYAFDYTVNDTSHPSIQFV